MTHKRSIRRYLLVTVAALSFGPGAAVAGPMLQLGNQLDSVVTGTDVLLVSDKNSNKNKNSAKNTTRNRNKLESETEVTSRNRNSSNNATINLNFFGFGGSNSL